MRDESVILAAGIDEAGCGPLAGPVISAAVMLDPQLVPGLDDSKKLTHERRESLAFQIRACAHAWAVGRAEVWEIDEYNIRQATLLAMRRAYEGLLTGSEVAYVDGDRAPELPCPVTTVIGGDGLIPQIGAASILAKVERDAEMLAWHGVYPHYGFDRHKGYGTALHRAMLERYGPSPLHRHSFSPVGYHLEPVPWSSLHPTRTPC